MRSLGIFSNISSITPVFTLFRSLQPDALIVQDKRILSKELMTVRGKQDLGTSQSYEASENPFAGLACPVFFRMPLDTDNLGGIG